MSEISWFKFSLGYFSTKELSEIEYFLLTESLGCAILTLVELLLFASGVLSRASAFDDCVRPPLSSINPGTLQCKGAFLF